MKVVFAMFLTLFTFSSALSNDDFKSKKKVNNSTLHVRLTDLEQSQYGLVIEIIKVEVYNDKLGWVILNDFQQSISSYSFTKGNKTLLANSIISEGKYSKLRLTFGNSNSIYKINDQNRNLKKLDFESDNARQIVISIDEYVFQNNTNEILIDFNISNSVSAIENDYLLTPELKVVDDPLKVVFDIAPKLNALLACE